MIDYRFATRVNMGIAVGSSECGNVGDAPVLRVQRRFSGSQVSDVQGRSLSNATGGGVCATAFSALPPFNKIAVQAPALAGGNAINLSITRIEASADRALSGARAWSPPD